MATHSLHLSIPRPSPWRIALILALITGGSAIAGNVGGSPAHAGERSWFLPGNLVVSRSVYVGTAATITPGVTVLPPGCTSGCAFASNNGSYPGVWNNDSVDGSFGVTAPVFLDQITQSGRLVNSLPVPASPACGSGSSAGDTEDHAVTSFSSKSEVALNLSTSGRDMTFMGYVARPNTLDVSNSNTPGAIDPTGNLLQLACELGMR